MHPDWQSLWARYGSELEDFWGRHESGPDHRRAFRLFGRAATLTSNHPGPLDALDTALARFSTAPPSDGSPFAIHLVVREGARDPGPLPESLFDIATYSGHGDQLSILLGGWGHVQIDVAAGRAWGQVVPRLGDAPETLAHGLLATVLTNLVIGAGFGMLHATGLVRGKRLLLLVAPHNGGKSTTALRLVLGGWSLFSDSQIYVSPDRDALELLAFPVGRLRLRGDMVERFPELRALLEPIAVRGETKYRLDLRALDAARLHTQALRPGAIDLCLLRLADSGQSALRPASPDEIREAVLHNSIFYDTPEAWARNLAQLDRLLARARCHHLDVGDDDAALHDVVGATLDDA